MLGVIYAFDMPARQALVHELVDVEWNQHAVPLFGIANQLLAAIALTVVTVVVIKRGLLKWAWIPGVPLLWDVTVTMTASWQKIFSADPEGRLLGAACPVRHARDAGKTAFGAAKDPGQIDNVIYDTSSRAPCRSSSRSWWSS